MLGNLIRKKSNDTVSAINRWINSTPSTPLGKERQERVERNQEKVKEAMKLLNDSQSGL